MQTSVCVHFITCVSAEEWDEAAVGAASPFVLSSRGPWLMDRWWSVIYCLQRRACILHSKLGRSKRPLEKYTLRKEHKIMHAPIEAPTHRARPFGLRQHSILLSHLQWKNLTSDPEYFQLGERGSQGMPCMSASKMKRDRSIAFIYAFLLPPFQRSEAVIIKTCLRKRNWRLYFFRHLLAIES